jgi:hypothetical protein
MGLKVYKLIIEFNEDTEEIEFIEESIAEDAPDSTYIGKIQLDGYYKDKDIDTTDLVKFFSGVVGEA